MKKIVLIDVDDTLLDFQKCSLVSLKKVFQVCHLDYQDKYHKVFLEVNERLWKQLERKEIIKEELFEKRFPLFFDILNIDGDSQLAEMTFRKQLSLSHEVMDGAQELLDDLVKKYDLYVVSNSEYQRQVNRLKEAGLIHYFKDIYTSERMEAIKPDYDFFEACFKEMGYPPKAQVVLIGDSLTADIQGALNYGIQPIWFHQGNDKTDVIQVERLEDVKKYL